MSKVHVVDHPLIQHKLTLMRKTNCNTKDFRQLLEEISMLMAYEVTRDLPLKEIEIETPVAKCKSKILAGKKLGIVPDPARRSGHGGRHAERWSPPRKRRSYRSVPRSRRRTCPLNTIASSRPTLMNAI